ncbi:hypothetical protein IW261DRAFT_1597542 [Armillaria novae-zelandiae]|uniref:Uncharacterized protein n=1 Tax=Armillaria novae-zelandiae TaxID=153914 RepID=A0AA39TZP2_9AGAR|nr:hypothetical protein IW261DRAFT_1597542 [Armillaria novae-zelandiae]
MPALPSFGENGARISITTFENISVQVLRKQNTVLLVPIPVSGPSRLEPANSPLYLKAIGRGMVNRHYAKPGVAFNVVKGKRYGDVHVSSLVQNALECPLKIQPVANVLDDGDPGTQRRVAPSSPSVHGATRDHMDHIFGGLKVAK